MKKKILALVLAVVMAVSMLASCELLEGEVTAEEVLKAASEALESAPYSATSTTVIDAKDPDLAAKLEGVSNAGITYSVNGSDFTARMSVSVSGIEVKRTYTVVDGILYNESIIEIEDDQTVIKKKAEIDETELSGILAEIGAGAELTYEDFETVELSGSRKNCTVVCTKAKAASLSGADEILGSALLDADVELTLRDATLTLVIKDGKYESVTLAYSYYIENENGIYNMTAELKTTYDYSTEVAVSAPQDAEVYVSTSYENAMN